MVSSQVEVTGREMLPEDTEQRDNSYDGSPLPAEPSSEASGPNLRIPTQNRSGDSNAKKSCQIGGYKISSKLCPGED